MGGHPLYGQGPGGVSDLGGDTADRKDPAEDTRWEVEIHLGSGGKGGGGILDNGEVYQAAAENGCTVHSFVITVIPVLGVGKGSGGTSRDVVVVAGGN